MVMNKYTEVGLYDHNIESYEKIKKGMLDKLHASKKSR